MNGPRGVVYAMLVAFSIFAVAGARGKRRLENAVSATFGQPLREPEPNEPTFSPVTLGAWALLFVIFIAVADFDASAELATSFAFLLLLAVILAFGPDAIKNVTDALGITANTPSGGGGGRKPLAE